MPYFHIPYIVVRSNSSDVLIKPILGSDYAHISTRYGASQPLKWAISHAGMVLFAM